MHSKNSSLFSSPICITCHINRTVTALPDRLNINDNVDSKLRKQWYTQTAKTIEVQWKPSELSSNSGAQVQVNLLGYKETDKEVRMWQKVKKSGLVLFCCILFSF